MNLLLALVCVVLFSLTVPFTRLAALEAAPEVVTLLRLWGAGLLCLVLILRDGWVPPRAVWLPLCLTSLFAVVGFAALMAFGLRQVPGSHGAVALAALPAVTAAYACLRDRRNPGALFWLFAMAGTLCSGGFFFTAGVERLMLGDGLLGLAVLAAAVGYVEGGRLSRAHGGRRIMSWAIVLTLPWTLALLGGLAMVRPTGLHLGELSAAAWLAIAYLALVSQSAGMFLWYRVLARGPMERVALMQLLQPFFTLLAALLILDEKVAWTAWLIALLVALCVLGANRAKARPARAG